MLGLFLQHHLEAAAHDILLVGIRVRRLATAYPVELGLEESVDDTGIVAMRASRGASTSSSVGVASRVSPSFADASGGIPP